MVRTTSFRSNHQSYAAYTHRSSTYIARPGYLDLSQVAMLLDQPESQPAENMYILPPKQPTPDVILRTDLMSERRSKVAL